MKRHPKLLSSLLQLSSTKHKSFTPTTQHKTKQEDEISPFPSSFEDSDKEEGEGSFVVVRF